MLRDIRKNNETHCVICSNWYENLEIQFNEYWTGICKKPFSE